MMWFIMDCVDDVTTLHRLTKKEHLIPMKGILTEYIFKKERCNKLA